MRFEDLGLVDYEVGLNHQLQALEKVQTGGEEVVYFCSHSPVVTLGRAFKNKKQEVGQWAGPVVETSRGGKATYHGPNQFIVYPILDLNREHKICRPKDVHDFLRQFECVIVNTLKAFDLPAKTIETPKDSDKQFTGVWVGEKKVASIGVGVKKWVTYHGCAINLEKDDQAFQGISPCGFTPNTMTSVEELLSQKLEREKFKSEFQRQFRQRF